MSDFRLGDARPLHKELPQIDFLLRGRQMSVLLRPRLRILGPGLESATERFPGSINRALVLPKTQSRAVVCSGKSVTAKIARSGQTRFARSTETLHKLKRFT